MKRIILFRYHKEPTVCIDRLKLLKHFNPEVSIYGLYGGEEPEFPRYESGLRPYLENNFCIKDKSNDWKWRNGDLAMRLWYKDIGKDLDFDVLHIIEWDLLIFDSLDNVYRNIPEGEIGITALTSLKKIESKWYWTTESPWKEQWAQLLAYVKDKFAYDQEPYASLGPGTCLPKSFLEKYSSIDVPELCHDELRLPLFGQVLRFELHDTGFYEKWSDPDVEKFFNCDENEILPDLINGELEKKSGRRVFHPFRQSRVGTLFQSITEIS